MTKEDKKDKIEVQIPMFSAVGAKGTLKEIPLTDLPDNDAEGMESVPPASEFIQDLMQRGLIDPIVVIAKDNSYQVIAGRRRIKAFRIIDGEMEIDGFSKIKAFVYKDKEFDSAAIYAASAHNNQRSANVITDINAIKAALKENPEMTNGNIAKLTGMPASRVSSRRKLFELHPVLWQALIDGQITTAVAEATAKLPKSLQEKLVDQFIQQGNKLSAKDVEDIRRTNVASTVQQNLSLPSFDPDKGKKDVYGYILVDKEAGNIIGRIGDLSIIEQDLDQYAIDYPEINLTIMKVVENE